MEKITWTANLVREVRACANGGMMSRDIAKTISAMIEREVTVNSILTVCNRYNIKLLGNHDPHQEGAFSFAAKRASILHLLDLKRAGHSPRFTEYKIETGDVGKYYPKPSSQSYLGSPAASCVG
jgi:hypothetical protein